MKSSASELGLRDAWYLMVRKQRLLLYLQGVGVGHYWLHQSSQSLLPHHTGLFAQEILKLVPKTLMMSPYNIALKINTDHDRRPV